MAPLIAPRLALRPGPPAACRPADFRHSVFFDRCPSKKTSEYSGLHTYYPKQVSLALLRHRPYLPSLPLLPCSPSSLLLLPRAFQGPAPVHYQGPGSERGFWAGLLSVHFVARGCTSDRECFRVPLMGSGLIRYVLRRASRFNTVYLGLLRFRFLNDVRYLQLGC